MAISKKRQALREAAKNLFYTQGFAAVSVEAICSAAHTSRVTFYKYYSGKNALVQELFAVPSKEVALEIRQDSIMSVAVPKLFADVKEAANASEVPYSYVGSNSEMDQAIGSITASLDDLLKLAEIEKTCQLMADEIEKTRRRVNGLEYQIIPQLEETIYYIEMKLEEAERANLIRMMKVKNM